MYKVKKIHVFSLAYTLALIYLVFGVILAIVVAVVKFNPSLSALVDPNLISTTYLQIVLLYPVAYTVVGFLTGLIIGFLYNTITKFTGGVSIELGHSSVKKSKKK